MSIEASRCEYPKLTMDIINALDEADDPLSWDELVDATDVDENTLDTKVRELQKDFIIQYSGRGAGYILHEDYLCNRDDV